MTIGQLEWQHQFLVYGLLLAIVCIAIGWWIGHRERVRLTRLVNAKFRTLASLAQNKPLDEKLTDICTLIEDQIGNAMCSVMLVDPNKGVLNAATALSLPDEFTQALQGLPIADGVGACGTAAYRRIPVVVEDMTRDARFDAFKDLIEAHNLRACWSYPVMSPTNKNVIGTFAVYFNKARKPCLRELDLIQRSRDLVALVIDQHNDRIQRERSEQHNRSLFSYNPETVFTLDRDGNFMSLNRAGSDLIGYDELEILGQHYEIVVPEYERAKTRTHFEVALSGKPQRYEIKIFDRKGAMHHLDITNMPIIINGEITGVHGIAKDVTAAKRNESQLALLERSVESSTNGLIISDANKSGYPIIYVNPAFKEITGYHDDTKIIGRSCNFLQGEGTDPAAVQKIRDGLSRREEVRVTIRNYRKDGTPFWNDLIISPVRDGGEKVTHFIGLLSDITERVTRQEELEYLAKHDVLTHLPNRNALEECLAKCLAQDGAGDPCEVAVLFIDLDGFKPINDSLGHAVGDRILVETAERLKAQMAPEDLLARFGGDEFVAVVTSTRDREAVSGLAMKLLYQFHQPYRFDELEVSLSATIGIADNSAVFNHPLELIQRADVAMYEAKRRGGSSYHWYSTDLDAGMQHQIELRTQLQEAIQAEQFELFYQPIVDQHGQPRAVEALIRWRHPEKGYISPGEFIPLAEATGQIIAIADWVFRQACHDTKALLGAGLETISVNFSPLQFYRDDFIQDVKDVMTEFGIERDQLVVEITENVFMRDSHNMIALLHKLRDLGLGLSIDDFGTGFASLSYLNQLPVDGLKIDQSFIHNVDSTKRNSAITRGVLAIASELDIRTVAEGVETEAERDYVVEHGCKLMQGYLFCHPKPLAEVLQWIEKQQVHV
ncbi:EAL domain-containing protein [Pseudidiomarina sp. 1APP75-32.1]|uniref:EAL domain-containing protein n=1 Tax=Pseudidiomarina terrestris TaxID=2820060 RepID=A0AAW7QZN1_9GAMM|nr:MULTISPECIES: EAL domain-containing protein [unclassified Pseudidiomarina]MDN7124917.1 EAL domain-containing protein [Pseudidiomarina sp. 1APP75-32.1]MDN7129610.1 EAL domain-containing protein [Pseudidiomarina sp. 1APR75-15]